MVVVDWVVVVVAEVAVVVVCAAVVVVVMGCVDVVVVGCDAVIVVVDCVVLGGPSDWASEEPGDSFGALVSSAEDGAPLGDASASGARRLGAFASGRAVGLRADRVERLRCVV